MFHWKKYQQFHVVRSLKGLIGKWWNADVFFLDEKGRFVNFFNENYFHNALAGKLIKDPSLNSSLAGFLREQTADSKQTKLLEWEKTGLSVLAVPIFAGQKWGGLIGVTGFAGSKAQLEKISAFAGRCRLPDTNIRVLNENEIFYMEETASCLAQEIIAVHEEEKKRLSRLKDSAFRYDEMIGKSPVMRNLYALLDKIKSSDSSILIQGESGTGKELVAQAIYKKSDRKNEAFIVQNCSALNDNLLESELFGHVKGAFTGAIQNKKGLFELADKGTFFLDEIGDTSLSMQAKLLRVLQNGTFFPVGSVQTKKVNVRIIAATNKDLREMIERGDFREDLYYRLNVINIKTPSLRERKEDISLLADYFLLQESRHGKKELSKEVIRRLEMYSWPGNIRELQNEIQRLAVLSQSKSKVSEDLLSKKFFGPGVLSSAKPSAPYTSSEVKGLKTEIKKLEKEMINRCLQEESWNKTRTAKKLGISRAALISKVKHYDLEKKDIA